MSTRKRLFELRKENLEQLNSKEMISEEAIELQLESLVVQEMYSVAEELDACRQTRNQMEQSLMNLQ